MTDSFIVLCGQVVGNEQDGFETSYDWDLREFATKPEAVSHGFRIRGSDDFNIGLVRDDWLVSLWWMDSQIDEDAATLGEIARQVGHKGALR